MIGSGRVEEVELQDGRRVACDHVLVAIGVSPAIGWLQGSGLEDPGGVPVDPAGRSRAPSVLAAGDAALTRDPVTGRPARGEHWESAAQQGRSAALTCLGLTDGRDRLPAFWSDQYGTRIHHVGGRDGADAVTVDGDPDQRDFTAWFKRDGRPVGALLVGRRHALPAARREIELSHANQREEGA
jgi:NADPH-dependent 2,4-dienoyl-CoA reductase/sulfur reductase-like enzyme